MAREVTERDLRRPEFYDAKLEDYEFREDGAIVRKDRWLTAIHKIRSILGDRRREFEIDDVIRAVDALVDFLPSQEEEPDCDGGSRAGWENEP